MATDDDQSRVFDVAKPGKSEPPPTSRPVIVGHGNMIEDPMVNKSPSSATLDGVKPDEDTPDPTKAKAEEHAIGPHQAKAIQPLTAKPADESSPAPDQPAAAPATPPEVPKTVSTPPPPQTDEVPGASDSLTEDDTKPKPKDDKEAEAEAAKQAEIQKLIESKQFVVHVGEVHHRKQNRLIFIVVAVVAVLVVGGVAVFLLG